MGILEWADFGAFLLAILLFCARIMRKGLTTLDDDRKQYLARISAGEKQLHEDRKNITSSEYMAVLASAVKDLVRLDGNPPGYEVHVQDRAVELLTPKGAWQIELVMRERKLRSTHKTLAGRSRWILTGFGHQEQFDDQAQLMACLNNYLHHLDDVQDLPQLKRGTHGA